MGRRPGGATRAQVWTYEGGQIRPRRDSLAIEEPLEIRLRAGGEERTLATTMRTPGNDYELAAGFLFGEGVVAERDTIASIRYCVDTDADGEQHYNLLTVDLRMPRLPDLSALARHFTIGSACGVCGRAGIESLHERGVPALPPGPPIAPALLCELPARLAESQEIFTATGGLHAAALFSAEGELLALREDIGRHNAVDKLVGWALLNRHIPLSRHILLVSGRAGYEIVQKAVAAGIPVVAAVSAPSSLAVRLAHRFNLTLAGFLRGGRFNIYAGRERLGVG